ncbi:polysaccharide lyase 8 family protein [Caulobacter sp. 73W]|uniref:Polysaccharide lyase 8 family protein n=1 Tax=Caulobacter sp. 73W TaxID=3161137 RepID=A0AB39KYJ3_9CAUL
MPLSLNRRAALGAAAGSLVLASTATSPGAAQTVSPFAALRQRWRDQLTGGALIDPGSQPYAKIIGGVAANASERWATLAKPIAGAKALWSDPLSGEREYNTRISADRLRVMALAWATPGTPLYGDRQLEDDLLASLTWLEQHRYSILIERTGNWWEWEMGIPIALSDLLILLHEPLTRRDPDLLGRLAAAIHRFTPAPFVGTAANRVWRSHVVLLNGAIREDAAAIEAARAAFPTTFEDVSSGDGFHADGSFIQHDDLPYTGGYGRELLIRAALLIWLLDGSPWTMPQAAWRRLADRVPTAFAPLMHKGALMDAVRGRNISRAALSDIKSGQALIFACLYLGEVAPRSTLKAQARSWIAAQAPYFDIFTYDPKLPAYWLTPHMAKLAAAAIVDKSIVTAPEKTGLTVFAAMDRTVWRRPAFSLALSVHSNRIGAYESVNGENLHGWYGSHGTAFVYDKTQPNYADDYWPTVDPYRLPGATLDRRPRADSASEARNTDARVGGAALDDAGLVAMAIETDQGGFGARKSWLMAGDLMLAMGSNIFSHADAAVETIVENRMLSAALPERRVLIDGAAGPALGETRAYRQARWLHLDGVGGLVLLDRPTLHAAFEARTGSWGDINKQGATPLDPRTRRYQTFWLDHGVRPTAAGYAYVLAPGLDARATAKLADHSGVEMIRKDEVAHVARLTLSDQTIEAAAFWREGRAGMFTADAPVNLVVRRKGGQIEIAVAEPTQARSEPITIRLDIATAGLIHSDPAISASSAASGLTLVFSPGGRAGSSARIRLAAA